MFVGLTGFMLCNADKDPTVLDSVSIADRSGAGQNYVTMVTMVR